MNETKIILHNKDNDLNRFIYNGIRQDGTVRGEYVNIPMSKDFVSFTLNIFCISPGFFQDIYNEAKNVKYQVVNIFPVSMDILFISDIARLVKGITELGKKCNLYFPTKIPRAMEFLTIYENAYQKTDYYSMPSLNRNSIVIRFTKPNEVENIYNIELHDGRKDVLIATKIPTVEYLLSQLERDDLTEIHVPYFRTLYGGLSFLDIMNAPDIPRKNLHKLQINGVMNETEYEDATKRYPNKIVEVVLR